MKITLKQIRQAADDAIELWVDGISRISELPSDASIREAKKIVAQEIVDLLRRAKQ